MKPFKLVLLILSICLYFKSNAQLNPVDLDIPMRDTKILKGDLYSKDTSIAKPTILIMTPYGKVGYRFTGLPFGIGKDFSKSNYNIVVVDWRGRFASLGALTVGSDNGEDGFDVVEWIASQQWSNGKIGTWGPSALGNVQFDLAKENPPHLVCCVPEVASPIFTYSKYHNGGVIETASFKTLNEKLFPGSYDLVIANPHYNNTWQFVENSTNYISEMKVPMLVIAGWFDHNIRQDIEIIEMLRTTTESSVRDKHKILIGPWVHGGTGQASLGTSFQGDLSFPEAEKWNDSFSIAFFDYHMRGISNDWDAKPTYNFFEMGTRKWRASQVWPPNQIVETPFYLTENDKLSTTLQTSASSKTYQYDPQNPTPAIGGKTLSDDLNQGPYDQRDQLESRSDVLLFTSEALENNVLVHGRIKVNLNVSSDKKDTDFAVQLNEVHPDGRSIKMVEGIQRMRFRGGYRITDTAFMQSGTVYPITIELDELSHAFLKGNKIRLVISSSSYPRYNRNMNTGGEMYPDNKSDTLVNPLIASNNIHFGGSYASSIVFPQDTSSLTNIKSVNKPSISVYPNPTSGEFEIKSVERITEISIYKSNGHLILTTKKNSINLKSEPSGVYLIKVKTGSGVAHSRVLIY